MSLASYFLEAQEKKIIEGIQVHRTITLMNNGCVFHAVSYLKNTAFESQASEFQSCVSGCSA